MGFLVFDSFGSVLFIYSMHIKRLGYVCGVLWVCLWKSEHVGALARHLSRYCLKNGKENRF